jgi:hypothetical protein
MIEFVITDSRIGRSNDAAIRYETIRGEQSIAKSKILDCICEVSTSSLLTAAEIIYFWSTPFSVSSLGSKTIILFVTRSSSPSGNLQLGRPSNR